jgi:hypothetical protein
LVIAKQHESIEEITLGWFFNGFSLEYYTWKKTCYVLGYSRRNISHI